ncbi:MAG: hypothetical protein ACK6CT_11000 [Planctomycetia bacterium]
MIRRLIAAAASLFGATAVLCWVAWFGVNVPVADDWDLVQTSLLWHDKGIDATSLLTPHNEHCIAIPRLAAYTVLKATGGNYRAVLFLNAALGIGSLVAVLIFASRWPLPPAIFAVMAGAGAALLSAWCQWQNWIWAFQMPWFLLPLILVTAALVVARTTSVRLAVVATGMATLLAPLCMASGMFVGWALLPALALRLSAEPPAARWRPFAIAVAVVIAATAGAITFVVRSPGPNTGGLAAVCAAPLEACGLMLAVLGSPLDPRRAFLGHNTVATVAGGLSLALGCTGVFFALRTAKTRSGRDLGPGFALMTYGLASIVAVVVGRLSMLAANPLESRYTTVAIAWHVGVLLTCGWLAAEHIGRTGRVWRILLVAMSVACLLPTLLGMRFFLQHGRNMRQALGEHQEIYRNARNPGGAEKLTGIARHYGADGILARLEGLRGAGMLHTDYAPAAAQE